MWGNWLINVLYDTFFATRGYGGIPQDTRLLLKTFASTPGVKVDALIHPRRFDVDSSPNAVSALDISKSIFRDLVPMAPQRLTGFKRFRRNAKKIVSSAIRSSRAYPVASIDKELFFDSIWRTRLEKSLLPSDRALMRSINYKYSPISEDELQRPSPHRAFPRRKLDTTGYDFLVFQDARVVDAHPDTIKLIRYHDPLAVTSPDTFADAAQGDQHYKAIAGSRHDSYFICNSEATQDQLVRLFPSLEERSFVIPCTLPNLRQIEIDDISFSDIALRRRSFVSVGELKVKPTVPDECRYLIMVSTLEPRKNFPGAIAAFERLIARYNDDNLRFVIVGRPGWLFEETLATMASGVKSGKIIHLTDVTFPELANLYRKAEALVFPSFGEGFGFTPMEALQFRTAGVVSDIATHRWVMGDAVLYADPYDPDAFVSQLARLLYGDNAEALRRNLITRGDAVLERYSLSATSAQWQNLFEKLIERPRGEKVERAMPLPLTVRT